LSESVTIVSWWKIRGLLLTIGNVGGVVLTGQGKGLTEWFRKVRVFGIGGMKSNLLSVSQFWICNMNKILRLSVNGCLGGVYVVRF
jgi:hypothetical protein